MPNIRPISDLRNNANAISQFCHESKEPVYITKNGIGDLVVMSVDTYEKQLALIDLYAKLAESEEDIANGDKGEDLHAIAKRLRAQVHGRI
ncbi:MAG: type II toxin-antitoxin system Phd/YefM family antitoxin [Oscillospiraceae bacterium]|nr:type II toxin-antitoxin system Phd/YefM family antitoxin [Oscillospiraceae bacterium]